jgi:hypothetical protein
METLQRQTERKRVREREREREREKEKSERGVQTTKDLEYQAKTFGLTL